MEFRSKLKPAERLFTPLEVPRKLLLGPGPSNSYSRVMEACSLPMLGHLHPEFLAVMDTIKEGLQYTFQTTSELAIAVSGTGHAGMEAAFVNVVEPGDVVLVLSCGIWGARGQDIAERCGAVVQTLVREPGGVFTLEEIAAGLEKHKPAIVFVCQGESSSGVCQPLVGVGELCCRFNCLLMVDTVASLGGVPFLMDEWGVDVVYSGSQKVLSVPPGTSPIAFGPRAREKMAARKGKVQSFYFDMNWLQKYWGVNGSPRVYHHTGPITSVYALIEGLAVLAQEGLDASWKRHQECAQLLWTGLEKLGLEMFVNDKSIRLPTVTTIKVPSGIDWKELVTFVMKKYSIEIAGGLGPTAGKVLRIGLMGNNCTAESVHQVLAALEDGLQHCRQQMKHEL